MVWFKFKPRKKEIEKLWKYRIKIKIKAKPKKNNGKKCFYFFRFKAKWNKIKPRLANKQTNKPTKWNPSHSQTHTHTHTLFHQIKINTLSFLRCMLFGIVNDAFEKDRELFSLIKWMRRKDGIKLNKCTMCGQMWTEIRLFFSS